VTTFVNSSWYFLRYCDPKNNKEIFDKEKVKYWTPVDIYIGGVEHACMHLIYFRFYTKFLRDLGLLDYDEPVVRLFNQGMLMGEGGVKMSKSKGNVINPDEVSKKYGMDTARFFLLSLATPDKPRNWSKRGIESCLRFMKKIMNYFGNVKIGKSSNLIKSKVNKTIKEVTEDIENLDYNLAIIRIRNLFESFSQEEEKKVLENFLKLLSPFCPHIAEELWSKLGNKSFISLERWPKAGKIDEKLLKEEEQVEKLVEDINNIKKILEGRNELKDKREVKIFAIPSELDVYEKAREKEDRRRCWVKS